MQWRFRARGKRQCHASAAAEQSRPGEDSVFSTPYHKSERANMTVFTSKDAGLSWDILQHIDVGPSAYSAMVPLNDTHIGLVHESGAYDFLTFRTVSLSPHDSSIENAQTH